MCQFETLQLNLKNIRCTLNFRNSITIVYMSKNCHIIFYISCIAPDHIFVVIKFYYELMNKFCEKSYGITYKKVHHL